MKSQAEIESQIKRLIAIRNKIKPFNIFGDSNLDKLDAQIRVLEENLDSEEVWDIWSSEEDEEVRISAEEAVRWQNDESDIEDLAADWPML